MKVLLHLIQFQDQILLNIWVSSFFYWSHKYLKYILAHFSFQHSELLFRQEENKAFYFKSLFQFHLLRFYKFLQFLGFPKFCTQYFPLTQGIFYKTQFTCILDQKFRWNHRKTFIMLLFLTCSCLSITEQNFQDNYQRFMQQMPLFEKLADI